MGRYINWSDVVDRYPVVSSLGGSSKIEPTHIRYAEAELESMLSGYFDLPFATTNLTAKDCAVELTYLRTGVLKLKEEKMLRESVMMKIEALKSGAIDMMLEDGTAIGQAGNLAYSDDDNYSHTYGVGDTISADVDHDKLHDEYHERPYRRGVYH